MENNLFHALKLIEEYNQTYNTTFVATEPYNLYPSKDGICEFRDQSWPCNGHAGIYLILSEDKEVLYVGQSLSFGSRFYQYFKDVNGTCVVRSEYWSKTPTAIVAVPAPDDKKYERLSLEEFLIQGLQPCDNERGK